MRVPTFLPHSTNHRYLLLMTGPMLGFAGAMVILFEGVDSSQLEDDCIVFSLEDERGGYFRTLDYLFELMLGCV